MRSAAEDYAGLGKARVRIRRRVGTSDPDCVPALVLAFPGRVNLGKLHDFSEHQFSNLSNGSTHHTGGCREYKG